MKNKDLKNFISNVFFAFVVQGISLILSFLMSLFLPKILDVRHYAYWQLFLFYISYVGFFHFGLNDGIYLRSGGKRYSELDYKMINSQFWFSVLYQIVIGIGLIIISLKTFVGEPERIFVVICTVIYMLLTNAANFYGYIFQTVNRVKTYSISVLIEKVVFIVVLLIQILFDCFDYKTLMLLYCFSRFVSLLFCVVVGKEIFLSGCYRIKFVIPEIRINISVGIKLMISTICGMFLMAIARIMVDIKFGIEQFGIFSFAFSLTNFFLTFISQVSMVLFPTLKNINDKRLKEIYKTSDDMLTLITLVVLFFYTPIALLTKWWLPQYEESIRYFVFLLPICIYDGKMNILYVTYFKVNRNEKKLLNINLISALLCFILCFISTYIIQNIYFIVMSVVICIGFRSVISCVYYGKKYLYIPYFRLIYENIIIMGFILITWFIGNVQGLVFSVIMYIALLHIMKDNLKDELKYVRKGLKG